MNSILTPNQLVAVGAAGVIVLVLLVVIRQATRTPGRPKDYRPEHVGATEQWSPKREVRNAPPAPAAPTKVLLEEAEAEFVAAHAKVARLRQQLSDEEDERYIRELRAISSAVTGQIAKIGHLEQHTVEVSRSTLTAVRSEMVGKR